MLKLHGLTPTKITSHQPLPNARCITSAVHYEIPHAPGCFLHIQLSHDGLTVGTGDAMIAVSLEELVNLAFTHEPSLVPELVPDPAPNNSGPSVAPAIHDDKFTNK